MRNHTHETFVTAKPIPGTDRLTLEGFIKDTVAPGSVINTDEHRSYQRLHKRYTHQTVRHSQGEYARGAAHTNTIESFWSLLKRGIYGVYHHLSDKHLARYLNEFTGRLNMRHNNTIDQMRQIAQQMTGKQLTN